jgi:hypothetical protein
MPRLEALLTVVLCGCAWPLDPAPVAPSPGHLPVLGGCPVFAGMGGLGGAGRSVSLADGATLWTFEGGPSGIGVLASGTDVCVGGQALGPAFDVSAGSDESVTPLDLARSGTDVWAFYEAWRPEAGAPFGVRTLGRGVAHRDVGTGRFVRRSPLFWTADRPDYGQSAWVDGGWLYAWGCEAEEGGWTRRCSVARVPVDAVETYEAWQYATSVGQFSPQVDDARPVLVGVGEVSVRPAGPERWLATYIQPLDTVLRLRVGLSPTGPFGPAVELGRCEVPAGAFCTGAVQHEGVAGPKRQVGLTWTPAAFGALADRKARWVVAEVPEGL